jgi:uncharacterized repeat protein (TIGR02543 family)
MSRLAAACLALFFVSCENPFIKDILKDHYNKDDDTGGTTTYTVTFNPDGGALVGAGTATVASGGTVASLPSATKADYDFGGWFTAQGGGGQAFSGATAVTASITVYAKWTAVEPGAFTVTFDADGGTPTGLTASTPSGGGAVELPTEPTRDGFVFAGWFTEQSGGGEQFSAATEVSASMTVYAAWTPTFTLTFATNGGSALASQTVAAGTVVQRPGDDPTRDGFVFAGWWTAETGGDAVSWPLTVSANTTVHAQWIAADTIGVTLDAGGLPADKAIALAITGGAGDPPAFSWYLNETIMARVSSFNDDDPGEMATLTYKWFIDGAEVAGQTSQSIPLSAQSYAAGTHRLTVQVTEGGLAYTLTRLFVIDGATPTSGLVSLNPNGGVDGYSPATGKIIAVGAGYTLPDPGDVENGGSFDWIAPPPSITKPYLTDRYFVNWTTNADGSGSAYAVGAVITTGMTLYAQWTPVWTVSYDKNGGGGTDPTADTVARGGSFDLPMNGGGVLPPGNKYLIGWATSASGPVVYSSVENITPTANITLYAKYNGSGVSTDSPIEVSDQAELAAMANGPNKYYKLANSFTITDWASLGVDFTGSLDGNGKTITFSGTITPNAVGRAGLFGTINGGTVKNLNLAGTITVSVSISTLRGGAVAGYLQSGAISNVKSTVTVSAETSGSGNDANVGGIAGDNYGTIMYCYSAGDVTAISNNRNANAGGIAGNNVGIITNCYVRGAIKATAPTRGAFAEGIAATSTASISNSVALNTSIEATGSTDHDAGRVFVYSLTGTNNWAVSMTVTAGDSTTTVSDGAQDDKNGANFVNSGVSAWTSAPDVGPGWTIKNTAAEASESAPWWWNSDHPALYWE